MFWDIQIGERRLVFSRATANPDFSGYPDTSVRRLRAKTRSGNGDFHDTPPAQHPPFYGAVGGGQLCLLFVCCLMDLPLAKCPTRRRIEPT